MGEKARSKDSPQFCDACFSDDYPIALTDLSGGRKDGQLSLLADVA
jgi:amidophosphoribosyltransferase